MAVSRSFAACSETLVWIDRAATAYRSATTPEVCRYRSAGRYHIQPCLA